MPKETSTAAHPELADLAASLGYVHVPDLDHMNPGQNWWDRMGPDGLLARLVVDDGGYEVHAWAGSFPRYALLWSARLTSGTPAAVLAAAMAVASEGTR